MCTSVKLCRLWTDCTAQMRHKYVISSSISLVPTFISVPPCERCPSAPKGYVPLAGLRSQRAEMAFSALKGGVQLHRDNGSRV